MATTIVDHHGRPVVVWTSESQDSTGTRNISDHDEATAAAASAPAPPPSDAAMPIADDKASADWMVASPVSKPPTGPWTPSTNPGLVPIFGISKAPRGVDGKSADFEVASPLAEKEEAKSSEGGGMPEDGGGGWGETEDLRGWERWSADAGAVAASE